MRKIKEWFIDKWRWLQTFNNMPKVTINCKNVTVREGEGPAITLDGRILLIVKGDLIVTENYERAATIGDEIERLK